MSEQQDDAYEPIFEDGKQIVSNEREKMEKHWASLDERESAASRQWLKERDQDKPQAKPQEFEPYAEDRFTPRTPTFPAWHENPLANAVGTVHHLHGENEQLRDLVRHHVVGLSAQQFAQRTPDYPAAINFLIEKERQQARTVGTPDAEFERNVMASLTSIHQRGLDPAAVMYQLAKERGFDVGHAYDLLEDDVLDKHWEKMRKDSAKEKFDAGLKKWSR